MKCVDCGLPEDRRHLCDRMDCLTRASSPVIATSPYLNKPLRSLAEVEALRADRPAPLFDCSPRIAIKLARCAEIARSQLAKTKADTLVVWTDEDFAILVQTQSLNSLDDLNV